MPANQKYSMRVHSRRQLGRASEHVKEASKVLCEIVPRYFEGLPRVSMACKELNDMMIMADSMITDIKDNM